MDRALFLQRFQLSLKQINIEPQSTSLLTNKHAAVLVPLIEKNNQLHVLFTVRASHLRYHAGQVSFPGGKFDNTDNNLFTTATRETHEEIGIPPSHIQVVGQLNQVSTSTGFTVTPIVAMIKPLTHYVINHNEVSEVFSVPLTCFCQPNVFMPFYRSINNKNTKGYLIQYQNYSIWGATANIMKQLIEIINQ